MTKTEAKKKNKLWWLGHTAQLDEVGKCNSVSATPTTSMKFEI
jgi:hypothetical protein